MNLRRTAFVGLLLAGCIVRQPKPVTANGESATNDPAEAPTPELPSDLPPSRALIGEKGLGEFALGGDQSKVELTKVAVDRLTEALRLELDPKGMRVSVVTPGLVDTPIYDKVAGFAKTRAKIAEQIPPWLTPADIAEAIIWVLSRPPHVVVSEVALMPVGQPR